MMNIDQARAGGEGMLSSAKKRKEEEVAEGPDLFQTQEQKVKLKIPEGWSSKES